MENIIEIKNVTYEYKSEEANHRGVKDITLSIEKGSFVVFLGHNGSGKSTLAKLLNGFLIPDEGDVLVDGINTKDEKRIFDIRTRVGMVFQNPDNQMVASIIEDDLAFGPENLGVPREEIRQRVDFALNAVNMYEHKDRVPTKLSGGQKQRVAIAAILAMLPDVIILDESTAMLDPKGRAEVMETVERLNKEKNMTVVLITHYMDEAVNADKIVILNKGEITIEGAPEKVFQEEDKLKEAGLELPVAAAVSSLLRKGGADIKYSLTDDELAEGICQLLK